MSDPIRLVLCDDHAIVLQGLEQVLGRQPDLEVVASCRDGAAALTAIAAHRPDVAVLDVRLPGMDGLAIVRELARTSSATRVVLLTAMLDDLQAREAIDLGVAGIVLKDMPVESLVECIRAVHAGATWHAPELVRGALRRLEADAATRSATGQLTPREMEIVRMVASGLRNKEVASQLGITEGTVKVHLHRIYEKLGIGGRIELIFWAQSHGVG
jgi:RNA polymerase sigma factor (sigma-70 family)